MSASPAATFLFFLFIGQFWPTVTKGNHLQNITLLHVQSKQEAGRMSVSSVSALLKRLQ